MPTADEVALGLSGFGTFLSLVLFLSQIPSIRRMAREGDAAPYPKTPNLLLLGNCLLWSGCAIFVQKRGDLLAVNAIGAAFTTTFAILFYKYTKDHASQRRQFWLVAGLYIGTAVLFAALFLMPFDIPEATAGGMAKTVAVVCNTAMFGGTIRAVLTAVKQLDSSRVPTLLTITCLLCAAVWGLFGVVIDDWFVVAPNAAGVIISGAQLIALGYISWKLRYGGKPTVPGKGLELQSTSDKEGVSGTAAPAASIADQVLELTRGKGNLVGPGISTEKAGETVVCVAGTAAVAGSVGQKSPPTVVSALLAKPDFAAKVQQQAVVGSVSLKGRAPGGSFSCDTLTTEARELHDAAPDEASAGGPDAAWSSLATTLPESPRMPSESRAYTQRRIPIPGWSGLSNPPLRMEADSRREPVALDLPMPTWARADDAHLRSPPLVCV
jgi:solute carrier family 50 protein (sugar transporter)